MIGYSLFRFEIVRRGFQRPRNVLRNGLDVALPSSRLLNFP